MRLLLFLLFPAFVFANSPQEYATLAGDPSSYIEGCVSAITGDLIIDQYDAVVQGAQPYPLRRRYISSDSSNPALPYKVLAHLYCRYYFAMDILKITEPNRLEIIYELPKGRGPFQPIEGQLNKGIALQPQLGGGFYDPAKNVVTIGEDSLTVTHSNGTKRHYRFFGEDVEKLEKSLLRRAFSGSKETQVHNYIIESETLPDGTTIHYQTDDSRKEKKRLINQVTVHAPASGQIFSQVDLTYKKKRKTHYVKSALIATSDVKELKYKLIKNDKKRHRFIEDVRGRDYPDEHLDYNVELRVSARRFPDGRFLRFEYDKKGRVEKILGPHGFVRTIEYRQDCTKTYDAEGNRTVYDFNPTDYRLCSIKSYSGKKDHLKAEGFSWSEEGHLLSRRLVPRESSGFKEVSYTYDSLGNPITETFSGAITADSAQDTCTIHRTYTQDGRNLLLREERPSGKITEWSYLEGTNLPTSMTTSDRETLLLRTDYQYNADHILIREITTDGSETRIKEIHPRQEPPFYGMADTIIEYVNDQLIRKEHIIYTEQGEIAKREIYDNTGSLAYTLTFTYDEKGRLSKETNPLGQIATYTYDANGNRISETTFAGLKKTYTYDQSNRCIRETEGDRQIQCHTHNALSQKVATKDQFGAVTTYTYDPLGNLLTETKPTGATTTYTYDVAGNPLSITDPNGHTTHTTYNIYGSPLQIIHPDGSTESYTYALEGLLESYTNQEGFTTRYTYDVLGRELTKTDPAETTTYSPFHKTSHTNALGQTTTYRYNTLSQLSEEQYADRITSYTYDTLGRLQTETTGSLIIHYTYDLLGRLLSEKHFEKETLLYQIDTTYDKQGNVATTTRYPGNLPVTERWEYDLFGREVAHINPLGHCTTLTYQETDHLIKTVSHPDQTTTIYTYDPLGQLLAIRKDNTEGRPISKERFTYDLAGNETSHTIDVYQGTTLDHQFHIEKAYNCLNLLKTLTENQTQITQYSYTPTGQIATLTKPDGTQLHYTYNSLGHRVRLTSDDQTVDYSYTYNPLGELLTSTNHLSGRTLRRTLDPHGNLLSEELPCGHTIASTYDKLGRRIALTLSTGHIIHYTYDAENLRSVTADGHTTHYTWDLDCNLLSQDAIQYTVDPLGRTVALNSPYYIHTLDSFDPMGNLLAETINGRIRHYTYDDHNQLTGEPAHTYTYDSLHNRLTKDNHPYLLNQHNQLAGHTYDPNGNPIQTDSHNIQYDALDRPIHLHGSYTYDSEHRREDLIWDGNHELGTPDTLRILGHTPNAEIGAAILIYLNNTPHTPIHDLHGNQVLLLDITNAPLEAHTYTAFGENHTPHLTPWGYRSKRTTDTLIDFGRRLYDPQLGRFLTPDPAGYSDGPNRYAYVANQPLTVQDPFGLTMGGNPQLYRSWHNTAASEVVSGQFTGITESALTIPEYAAKMAAGTKDIVFGDYSFPTISQVTQDFSQARDWLHTNMSHGHESGLFESSRQAGFASSEIGQAFTIAAPIKLAQWGSKVPSLIGRVGPTFSEAATALKTTNATRRLFQSNKTAHTQATSSFLSPQRYFASKTHREMEGILRTKFGDPRPGAPGGKSFFNSRNARTFHLHHQEGHMGGKPHVDIRRRGPYPERKYLLKDEL